MENNKVQNCNYLSSVKTAWLMLLLLFIFNTSLNSQVNYISNPGFEEISDCDLDDGQILKAYHWQKVEDFSTPDLFHGCSENSVFSVPQVYSCHTLAPYSGIGMAGLVNLGRIEERIFTRLKEPLPTDKDIYVAYHIAVRKRCDGPYVELCYSNSQSLAFEDVNGNIKNILELEEILDVPDTWTKVETSYQATGDEVKVLIGNYKPPAETRADCDYADQYNYAYFYVDEVIVTPFDIIPDTVILCGNEVLQVDTSFYDIDLKWLDGVEGGQRIIDQAGNYTVIGEVGNRVMTDQIEVIKIEDDESYIMEWCPEENLNLQSPVIARWSDGTLGSSMKVRQSGVYYAEIETDCGMIIMTFNVEEKSCGITPMVPNIFSPNGDGVNDELNFVFHSEVGYAGQLAIFDRWGSPVLRKSGAESLTWDGSVNGVQLATGVYVWSYIYTMDNDDKQRVVTGSITLVR